jgi:polysaccharide chain length determinant protein (PEP-CTERM system associated)
MHELLNHVSTVLRGMWKYRRTGMAMAWLVAVVVAGAIFMIPDRYQATARIYVDTQSILRPLMSGLVVQPNIEQQVAMLSRTLINRPTVERLVRMADLDLATKDKVQRDQLIDRVTGSLAIRSAGQDNLYTLSYVGNSPAQAARVVQALTTIFVESSLGGSRTDADNARRFIDEQIKSYEGKLAEAETRLKEFRLRHLELQTEGGDIASRIAGLNATLNQARLELREAESAREAARRQLDEVRTAARGASQEAAAAMFATPDLDARLANQRQNVDNLLQRFTEEHPDVVYGRKVIRELEQQRAKAIADMRKAAVANPSSSPVQTSPAVQELIRIHSAAEVQVASLRARVTEFESRAVRARELARAAPQVEAELAQLNRDYEIHRKNYQDLVSRRESINISGDLEGSASLADFRVIDPPRAQPRPVAPNRALLMPVALLAALAAGAGMAFLMSQLRPVYFNAASLRESVDLPLLGVVALVRSKQVRKAERRSFLRFAGALGALVLVFLGVMAYLSARTASLA